MSSLINVPLETFELDAAALAADLAALETPPPIDVEDPPVVPTLGSEGIEGVEVEILGTETLGTLMLGAEIFETFGKNGIEL